MRTLSSFQGQPLRYHTGGRHLGPRTTRSPIYAYAIPHVVQRGSTPREVLGVSQDADVKEIKRAFRKLALKLHPDRQEGSESEFLEVLRAYEILVGKCDGKESVSNADWDFHDWYWRFTMNRSKHKNAGSTSGSKRVRTDFNSQLAGLRQRAAVRAARQRAGQTATSPRTYSSDDEDLEDIDAYSDTAESPADSGNFSGTMNADQQARCAEEARRRVGLNSSEAKESVSSQLSGLKRRAYMRQNL